MMKLKTVSGLTIALGGLLLGLALALSPGAHTQNEASVYVLDIDSDIKAGTVLDVRRAVRLAEADAATHLIVRLDTPGGLLESTRQITEQLLAADLTTVAYVHKSGGWAFSAGTIILLAAEHAYLHPTAAIGAAQPFSPAGENEIQDQKALEATAVWVRGLAGQTGKDPVTAERFVTENLTLSGNEAVVAGVADGTAENLDAVLEELGLTGAQLTTIEPTMIGALFNFLSHPFLVSLFLALGGLALVMAVRTGEFAFSAAIGVALLLVGLWGIGIIEFSLIGIGLLLLGVLLLMIEVFDEPGFGIFGVGGIAAIFFGIITLSQEPFFKPQLWDAVAIAVFGTLALGAGVFIVISRAVAKSLRARPTTGAEALIGQTATVQVALAPRGRVSINGTSWQAELVGAQRAQKGSVTCIIDVRGNTLLVEPKDKKGHNR